jgi:hypothetical protein
MEESGGMGRENFDHKDGMLLLPAGSQLFEAFSEIMSPLNFMVDRGSV